jgi:hypothetical protein
MLPSIDVGFPRTDFVTALLAVVDESSKQFHGLQGSHTMAPGSDNFMINLRRLEVEASIAGFGNFDHLSARGHALDSDAFATEVMRKSRSGIRFREKLAVLMSEYSQQVSHQRYLGRTIQSPIFVATFTNAEISINPHEMSLLYKNIKHMNVPNLFFVNINDMEDRDLSDLISPSRKLTREELLRELSKGDRE